MYELLALAEMELGNLETSKKIYLRVLIASKEIYGEKHIDYIRVLGNLAIL
jgi:hypothetical protein